MLGNFRTIFSETFSDFQSLRQRHGKPDPKWTLISTKAVDLFADAHHEELTRDQKQNIRDQILRNSRLKPSSLDPTTKIKASLSSLVQNVESERSRELLDRPISIFRAVQFDVFDRQFRAFPA